MIEIEGSKIRFTVCAAPLAGITDPAYQTILQSQGCQFLHSEMVSAEALVRQQKKEIGFLGLDRGIHPVSVQIFGSNPETMSRAARIIESLGADAIDINMGCPVKKIVASGSGVALMRDPLKARQIMTAVRDAVSVPVSVKFRLGWDPSAFHAPVLADHAAESGLSYMTVHGRYRQSYQVPADWDAIHEIKRNAGLPVIGNGDVFSAADAFRMMNKTGCDAVMIGRGLLGNPWLPAMALRYLETSVMSEPVGIEERSRVFIKHFRLVVDRLGDRRGCLVFRKHAAWYMKGLPEASRYRSEIFRMTQPAEYERFAENLAGPPD